MEVHVVKCLRQRRAIIIGVLVWIVVSGCSGKPAHPQIELSVNPFDLGDIHLETGKQTETLAIKNAGGAPLMITSISTSCGCTKAEIDTQEIPPGEHAQLTVIYDPAVHPNLVGKFKRVVYIESNDPTQKDIELEVIGNTLPASTD